MATGVVPRTWPSGVTTITKADLDAEIRDHLNWLKTRINSILLGDLNNDGGVASYLSIVRSALTDYVFEARNSGSAQWRFRIRADGQHEWGNGAGVVELNLSRSGADTLYLAGGAFAAERSAGGGGAAGSLFAGYITGDAHPRISIGIDTSDRSRLALGPGNVAPDVEIIRGTGPSIFTSTVIRAAGGVITLSKSSGTPSDSDFPSGFALAGALVWKEATNELYIRASSTWRKVVTVAGERRA